MAIEVQSDIANGQVYRSKYLTEPGIQKWDKILLEAVKNYDSEWLAQQLLDQDLAIPYIITTDKRGHSRNVKLQPENLADSEFNRYYIRGICLRAIEDNIRYVITYRAKAVQNPMSRVGIEVDPHLLLDDLRHHKKQTALAIPSNPNSGISVMLPESIVSK